MSKGWTIFWFIVAIASLSLLDLGMNLLSFIPGVGPLLETLGEAVIETIQVAVAGLGLYIVGGSD